MPTFLSISTVIFLSKLSVLFELIKYRLTKFFQQSKCYHFATSFFNKKNQKYQSVECLDKLTSKNFFWNHWLWWFKKKLILWIIKIWLIENYLRKYLSQPTILWKIFTNKKFVFLVVHNCQLVFWLNWFCFNFV